MFIAGLKPWLDQQKPGLGQVRPIPWHALTPDVACIYAEGSGDKSYESIRGTPITLTGGVSWCPDGLSLDGTDDYANLAYSPAHDLSTACTIITRFWFVSTGESQTLVDRSPPTHAAPYQYYLLQVRGVNDTPIFTINNAGTAKIFYNTTVLAGNSWYTLAVTYDGVTYRPYLNGIALTPEAYAGTITCAAATTLSVGRRTNLAGAEYCMQGEVAYTYIYQRVLDASAIAAVTARPFGWLGTPDIAAMWAAQAPVTPTGRALFLGANLWTGGKAMIREANL